MLIEVLLEKNKLNTILYDYFFVNYNPRGLHLSICSTLKIEGVDTYFYVDNEVMKVTSHIYHLPEEIGFIR